MNKKIRFSLLTLLVMLCGTVFAEDSSKTLTMNTAAGYAELTVTKAGTSGSGSEMEISKDDIIVTSAKGYIKDHEMTIYKSGTMTVSLGDSFAGNHITKVVLNVNNYHFSPTITGWTAGDTYQTTDKVTGDNAEEFTPSTDDKTSITLTNVSAGKTTVKSITVYYASAAAPQAYTVDFNTAITTSSHDFKVASNWKHIVHRYNDGYSDYYMSYSYGAETGVEGSGALYAGQQRAGDNWDYETTYDFLVTPVVSGEVTIYAKKNSTGTPFVEFWSLNETATAKNEKLHEVTTFENDTWTAVTFNVATPQRIGIRAQYVYLDNFSAASAVIEQEKSIMIATAEPSATTGTIYWDQQENGKVQVKYTVTVTNNGEVALTQGMENYSISVFNRKTNEVYFTVPVPQNLAIGETSEPFEVSGEIETTTWANSYTYINMDLMENLQGSTVQRAQSQYKAYEPKFIFRVAESSSSTSLSGTQAYGLVSEATTRNFEIRNDGAAPLTIKTITLPTGFTSDNLPEIPAKGLVIAKYSSQALNITLPIDANGAISGDLIIVYFDKNGEEQTYTLGFSGSVLGAGTWFADFNNTTNKAIFPEGSVAETGIRTDYSYNAGTYDYFMYSYTSSSYANANNKFVTPKLHANADDKLTFDVRRDESSSSNYNLKVYVSTDRKTWGDPVFSVTAADLTSAFQTKEISFAEAGDYYVAFAIYGVRVDNIIGLTKVDVAHDLFIKSVNWPDASVKSGTSQSKPSVEIIPLTNEVAEAYTVKYVCGETVLAEGTPVELTASNSKTFTFNWTPQVESTTVYDNTKIVFDFGNNVTFETEPFTLTVTNEPKFHFVSTIPTSKWSEPSDLSTPIAFGKTNQADKKTFYVYNWGSAPLTVKSIAVPAGFTATPAEQFVVAAFDESDMSAAAQAVEITFSATEADSYSGDMVITYVDGAGADQTFTLAVSGTKLDPTKWYANFDDGGWPAGSVYQKNISSSNGGTYNAPNYYFTSSSATDNIFVTPKLTATEGEKLLFNAKLYSSYWSEGKVVVYAAATREEVLNAEEGTTRVQLFSISGQDETNPMTTDYQTYEVTVSEAGDYFFGFEISGRPYVDELYGLKPAAVAHDLKIASSSVPTTGMQNNEYTASVNIQNFGLSEEAAGSYEMNVYVNNELMASGDAVAIPMNHKLDDAGTAIAATFRYSKVGTFPVYVEVKAGDYSVKTAPVDVTFAEEVAVADAIAVGTKSSSGRDYGFVDWYNNDGNNTRYTDILYPAAKLTAAGIKAGDKINSIAFRASNSAKTINAVVTSWVSTSTGEVTLGSPAKENMQEISVYNGSVEFPANFESVITLTTPIVWDGTSDIRVYTEAVGQGSSNYVSANYDYDSDIQMSYNGTTKAAPLAYFTLALEPATYSGTVKNAEGDAIEGATVTLISNDGDGVEYTGTTDAEGAYSINVIQTGRQYNVEVDAEGYESASAIAVSFAEGSVTKDFVIDIPLVAKYIDNPFFTGTPVANGITTYAKDAAEGQVSQMQAVNGWQFGVENGDARASGTFAIGGSAFLGGTGYLAPAVGAYDETQGNVLGLVAVWSGTVQYTNKTVTLQPGTYTLTVPVYNAKGGTTVPAKSLIGFIADNGTEYLASAKSYAVDKWTYETVSFNLSEETTGKFSLGYTMTNVGSASAPHLFIGALSLEVKTLLDGVLDELTAELTYAYSLKTEDRTAGLEAYDAAILTAEGLLESTDVATIKAGIEALQAAENAFVIANMPVAEGKYYIYNIGTQKYLAAGANWGTHAIVNETGVDYEFAIADGKYTLDSQISNGGNNHFLNGEWNDGAAMGWTIAAVKGKEGVYTISNGEKFLTAGENGLVTLADDATAEAAQWSLKTLEARIAELATATAEAPVDATFLIQDANFGRNDLRKSAWKMEASNQNLSGGEDGNGSVGNNCAESYHAVFTLTQTLTNVPAGKYKMTAQGFYRQDGDAVEDAPVFYANAKTSAFPVKTGSENSMTDASKSFSAGLYTIEPIEVVVSEDSILTIGAKGTATSQWVIWDNFRLSYYGEEPALAGDANLDGEVTTSDAVAAVSFALEKEVPSEKAFKAADVNNSNSITVSDAVGIVNIALNKEVATARGSEMTEAVNFLTMNGSSLNLMNTTEFVGFQMDVTLADGAQFNGVQLASRAAGLQVIYNRIAGNTYRIIAFSTGNAVIEGNEGELFTLDIAGNHNINITNIEFADADAQAYAIGFAETTGINGIYAGAANVESYTVGGVKNDKVRKGMNIVRTADGKVKKVFVK